MTATFPRRNRLGMSNRGEVFLCTRASRGVPIGNKVKKRPDPEGPECSWRKRRTKAVEGGEQLTREARNRITDEERRQ